MGEIIQPSDDELKAVEAEKPFPVGGSKDTPGGGDHDTPYTFGRKPSSKSPFPFTMREYTRLLILRSRSRQYNDHPNILDQNDVINAAGPIARIKRKK